MMGIGGRILSQLGALPKPDRCSFEQRLRSKTPTAHCTANALGAAGG